MQPISSTLGIAQPATASQLSAAAKAPTSTGTVDQYGGSVEPETLGDKARFLAFSGGLGVTVGTVGFPLFAVLLSAGDVLGPDCLILAAAGAVIGGVAGVVLGATSLHDAAVKSRTEARDDKARDSQVVRAQGDSLNPSDRA